MYFIQFNEKIIYNSTNMLEAYSRLEEAAIDYAQSLGPYCTTIFKKHYSNSNSYYCMSNKLGEVEVWKVRLGTFYNSRSLITKFVLVSSPKVNTFVNKKPLTLKPALLPDVMEDLKNFLKLRESVLEINED
jgi:hypothetical protein